MLPDSSQESPSDPSTSNASSEPGSGSPSSEEAVSAPDPDAPLDRPETGRRPREIRAATVSIDRTGHGVTLNIVAGKLRLRLYIDSQWPELVRQISAGDGSLDQLVPFRMVPIDVEEEEYVSARTIDARPIPDLSSENPLYGTPLWDAFFPPEEPTDPAE